MKLKKSHIIPLILFSGLLIAKPVFAEEVISSDNTPMGHYIEQEQSQEASTESTSDSSTTPNIRAAHLQQFQLVTLLLILNPMITPCQEKMLWILPATNHG